jgi:hypothetical protein
MNLVLFSAVCKEGFNTAVKTVIVRHKKFSFSQL